MNCQVKPPLAPLASRTRTRAVCEPGARGCVVWMVHSRGERLSIWASGPPPSTASEAVDRSAPRPTRTADVVIGPPTGTCALAAGAMVRTMGGAGGVDGEAMAEGDAAALVT